ncbi:MAG TPA: Asp-tRNA(Asn)/Glu-tRNA(Gln) amidotransferase subunit GatB [Spirochaetota bacterium]|nr:MAG: Aspartyl/glutamyl-tRNA(Asn/Gln) amidotransferase subunit B [Spirochaetes bacterium ADurb.BinA120]HNU92179.1 Asp-tRNA(Asn)/Glu-tRNA(Gln) amidotransferase subunit GatB [Spirochaetota bacterium]HPI14228.1 Asp-tRNA(Asn)/Glu-tRNA(Gln) amidotransferase subunit GatB [Spirochaetota bacterium]HPO44723.1 Asp-tRNA(Asn)/Glu-tRNA(Gln) amidotransferase subunit GatB [Spirochaetota bacterium]HPV97446.1 Asp-tRNA(Asn)/Glu-tRNA(Gln) amidotransferase subunit GatB [Spirochaetota bacterium]
MEFEPVIGLEVHVQLNTRSKIFCGCPTAFKAEPNSQTCPICLGFPGTLPVLNEEVLRKAIMAGLALNATVSEYSKFDRKNYFYPDLPKAYQISQFDRPICSGGYIEVTTGAGTKRIGINRLHLEEDAGKSIHSDEPGNRLSYLDFNRSGMPLAEIVSEPDMRSAEEAYEYLQNLRTIMKYLDVSDCNMEEGSLRCDVNISLREKGASKLGEKVEVKNLNSFKAVKTAIEFEIRRQAGILEDGGSIVQETRLWDADRGMSFSMRSKEEAHDYRYFPDPDLPPIKPGAEYVTKIRESIPELPGPRRERFIAEYGLSAYDAGVLTSARPLADYFESVVKHGAAPKKASNWIQSELLARVDNPENVGSFTVKPEMLTALLALIDDDTISGKIAKTVFDEMVRTGADPSDIVRERGLVQLTDMGAIESIIDRVIAENPESVADYKSGKERALKFLMGQAMKESKGKANPRIVNDLLLKKLR